MNTSVKNLPEGWAKKNNFMTSLLNWKLFKMVLKENKTSSLSSPKMTIDNFTKFIRLSRSLFWKNTFICLAVSTIPKASSYDCSYLAVTTANSINKSNHSS
ncbi:hypothetical protein WICPIJ_000267 [Wickerhamomyces pijperi]|uniref:Uncharacterized protein n=1 Tax=Wickerhamomyces pijperi TaxID=599730 RepID=A0A9P8TS61_WICPI|nr:hypothetical protein WICPIJ_000267 [Wickerhamomyces pijperi]